MTEHPGRDRFIPFRKRDVCQMLLDDGGLKTDDAMHDFQDFCKMVESIFHFEFHRKLEHLKDSYFPINPDLQKSDKFTPEEIDECNAELFGTLREVLDHANYDEISAEEVARAYESDSALKAKIRIDMEDFESIQFFSRGRRMERVEQRQYYGLKKQVSEHEILERVVLLVRFKPKEYFDGKKRRDITFEPGSTMVKLFKDVPKEDLEILFPNSRVTMGMKDKLILAVPAVAGGVPLLVSKVLPAMIVIFVIAGAYFGVEGKVEKNQLKQAIAAFSALAALGGFCLKQWMKYKNKRYQFQKELTDNLYYRNLVNNVGVFHSLVDSAEESECKEAFLAYYFLHTAAEDLTEQELDELIESWFEKKHGCKLDFECDDAVRKLEELNLLEMNGDGVLKVPPFSEALRRLDEIWDNYFQYHNEPGNDMRRQACDRAESRGRSPR